MTTDASAGPGVLSPDVLDGLAGIVVRVRLLPDGRAKEVIGVSPDVHAETGHFFASVSMVLDTLVGIWSEVAGLDAVPLRAWTARCGRYWIVGAGEQAWVLDSASADIEAVCRRLEAL